MRNSYYGECKPGRQSDPWHFLNRLAVVLIAGAVLTLVVSMFLPELRKQQEQEKRLACLRAQIDKAKATLDHRTRELGWLANDPGYIEVLAREKLEKMKQGETIFRPASP